jgi:hypothetical protein
VECFGVPLLMEACPSFANRWEAEVRDANLDEEVRAVG